MASIPAGCGSRRMERVAGPGHVVELRIGGKTVRAETALDEPTRNHGLMFRESLGPDEGMLFVWPRAGERGFYMKNTSIPLSIAFVDEDGKVLEVKDMKPHDERRVWSKDEVRYALEVNQGWFQRNGLGPGAVFEDFQSGVRGLIAR